MKSLVFRIFLVVVAVLALLGCKGPLSGKEYTSEEITGIAEYLSVSKERIEAYRDGNITIQELGVSSDRIRQAVAFVKDNNGSK